MLRADDSEYDGLAYETSDPQLSVNASWEVLPRNPGAGAGQGAEAGVGAGALQEPSARVIGAEPAVKIRCGATGGAERTTAVVGPKLLIRILAFLAGPLPWVGPSR